MNMSQHDDSLFRRTPISLGVMAAMAGTGAPVAAEAEESERASEIEEIIVTARKREQSIQDAPLPIQAFDNEAIREKGLRTFQDYVKELTSSSYGTASPGPPPSPSGERSPNRRGSTRSVRPPCMSMKSRSPGTGRTPMCA
ncbi:MAG: hypothetical protein OXG51_12515 [Gammaproteobacteria bacterium]|nr:hypothetical protein [Gammaproteobacteria bacterium]